ncbi:MAG: hypothetical protein GXY08_04620 [Ruminococcus sp.]|nr:hypothetical protein [Ruminococcus sp.]
MTNIIDVGTQAALDLSKAASEHIDEIFRLFGLKRMIYAGEKVGGEIEKMVM